MFPNEGLHCSPAQKRDRKSISFGFATQDQSGCGPTHSETWESANLWDMSWLPGIPPRHCFCRTPWGPQGLGQTLTMMQQNPSVKLPDKRPQQQCQERVAVCMERTLPVPPQQGKSCCAGASALHWGLGGKGATDGTGNDSPQKLHHNRAKPMMVGVIPGFEIICGAHGSSENDRGPQNLV